MDRDLDRRLAELAREPRSAPVAARLRELLGEIREGFEGEVRQQLEEVVAEALARHLRIVESRRRADDALADLHACNEALTQALYGLLLRMAPDEGATRH